MENDQGTRYVIRVHDELGPTLADELGACRFDVRPGETVLEIDIIDQAHLHGVLERLRDLNVELESVNPA